MCDVHSAAPKTTRIVYTAEMAMAMLQVAFSLYEWNETKRYYIKMRGEAKRKKEEKTREIARVRGRWGSEEEWGRGDGERKQFQEKFEQNVCYFVCSSHGQTFFNSKLYARKVFLFTHSLHEYELHEWVCVCVLYWCILVVALYQHRRRSHRDAFTRNNVPKIFTSFSQSEWIAVIRSRRHICLIYCFAVNVYENNEAKLHKVQCRAK